MNHTKNRTLVTCTVSNNTACTVHVTIFSTSWHEIPPCFDFYVVTRSYSSRPFLCALAIHTLFLFTSSVWGLFRLVPTTCLPTHTLKGGRCIDDSHRQRWSPSCTLIALLCSKHCVAELLFRGRGSCALLFRGRGSCALLFRGRGSCALLFRGGAHVHFCSGGGAHVHFIDVRMHVCGTVGPVLK